MIKVLTILTATFVLLFISAMSSFAASHITDGDLIKAQDSFDIYIVKLAGTKKFKRLILNPDIFNSYGHLKWENVKTAASSTLAEYVLSEFVIEVNADGIVFDPKVYKVSSAPDSDMGERKWLNITSQEFASLGYDWDSIYRINHTEAAENFYPIKPPLTYEDLKPPVDKSRVISFSRPDCSAEVPTSHISIQSAIDAAKSGDKICILSGTYKGNIKIDGKDMALSGTAASSTIITGDIIIKNVSKKTIIENITVTSSSSYAILLDNASAIIQNSIVKDNFAGIRILGNSIPDIRYNVFLNNTHGSAIVHNGDSGGYAIDHNTFVDNGNIGASSTVLFDAAFTNSQIKITNNILKNGVIGIHEAVPTNSVISNNLFYGQTENYVRKMAINYNSVSALNDLTFAENNIALDPVLDSAWRPRAGSPAIGAADDRKSNIGAF